MELKLPDYEELAFVSSLRRIVLKLSMSDGMVYDVEVCWSIGLKYRPEFGDRLFVWFVIKSHRDGQYIFHVIVPVALIDSMEEQFLKCLRQLDRFVKDAWKREKVKSIQLGDCVELISRHSAKTLIHEVFSDNETRRAS